MIETVADKEISAYRDISDLKDRLDYLQQCCEAAKTNVSVKCAPNLLLMRELLTAWRAGQLAVIGDTHD